MVSVFTTGFPLLGRFAKLRKATNALVVSVCRVRPPAREKQLDFHWVDFPENLYFSIFPKYVEKL